MNQAAAAMLNNSSLATMKQASMPHAFSMWANRGQSSYPTLSQFAGVGDEKPNKGKEIDLLKFFIFTNNLSFM